MPGRPSPGTPGVTAAAQRPDAPPSTRSSLAPPIPAQPARSRSKSPLASRFAGVGRTGGVAGAAVVEAAGAVVAGWARLVAGAATRRPPLPASRVSSAITAVSAARPTSAARNTSCNGDSPNRRGGSARCLGARAAMGEYCLAREPPATTGSAGPAHLGGDVGQDAVHEPARVGGGQQLGQLDGLVEDDRRRYLGPGGQLEGGQAEQVTVDQRHPLDRPVLGGVGDAGVQLRKEPGDPVDQLDGVGVGGAGLAVVAVAGQHLGHRPPQQVGLEQDVEGPPAGGRAGAGRSPGGFGGAGPAPPMRQGVAHCTRVRYAPERVSTLIRSPVSTNSGTWTTAPVSTVAGLVAPETRSPLMPGSVSVTSSSTAAGSSTPMAVPS